MMNQKFVWKKNRDSNCFRNKEARGQKIYLFANHFHRKYPDAVELAE